MSNPVKKSQFWLFTENSDAKDFWEKVGDIYESNQTHIQYICGQLEQGTHLHFQGCLSLKRAQARSWLKNNVSATASFRIMNGTMQENKDYCSKQDGTELPHTFIEFGTFREKGEKAGLRNDLIALREAVKEGKTQREIIDDDDSIKTFARFIKFHDRLRVLYKPKPRENGVHVSLYVGDPGTGKTRRAYQEYPNIYEIPISNGTMWMDGYDDQPEVLFDDFMGKGSKMGLDNTLKFLDRYVRSVPFKGGYAWYRPEKIIVTSNFHPRSWYDWKNREISYAALARRIHRVIVFDNGEEVELEPNEYFYDRDLWPQEYEPRENQQD